MKLRKWQKKAFPIWWKNKSGILKVVTGGGKTFFALHCIKKFLMKYPERKVLIVVPSIPLLDQWSIELKEHLECSIAINGGGTKLNQIKQINITTIGSLKNIYKKFKDHSTFLIVDECHKLGTPTKGKMLSGKWAATMGLSATPERDFDDYFEKIISPILGPIVFEYDYLEAKKDNVISKFELLNAYAPMLEDEDLEYKDLTYKISRRIAIQGGFDKSDEVLKILFFKRARVINNAINRIPLGIKLLKKFKNSKWLVFSETKKQASQFNKLLNKNGFRSAIYNTDINLVSRQANLYEFKNDMLDVLVTCKALDEGFDYPEINAALILSASTTTRQRIQRMGRVLRTSKIEKNAMIISIYSSDSEFDRLTLESKRFIEEGITVNWTSLIFKK